MTNEFIYYTLPVLSIYATMASQNQEVILANLDSESPNTAAPAPITFLSGSTPPIACPLRAFFAPLRGWSPLGPRPQVGDTALGNRWEAQALMVDGYKLRYLQWECRR